MCSQGLVYKTRARRSMLRTTIECRMMSIGLSILLGFISSASASAVKGIAGFKFNSDHSILAVYAPEVSIHCNNGTMSRSFGLKSTLTSKPATRVTYHGGYKGQADWKTAFTVTASAQSKSELLEHFFDSVSETDLEYIYSTLSADSPDKDPIVCSR